MCSYIFIHKNWQQTDRHSTDLNKPNVASERAGEPFLGFEMMTMCTLTQPLAHNDLMCAIVSRSALPVAAFIPRQPLVKQVVSAALHCTALFCSVQNKCVSWIIVIAHRTRKLPQVFRYSLRLSRRAAHRAVSYTYGQWLENTRARGQHGQKNEKEWTEKRSTSSIRSDPIRWTTCCAPIIQVCEATRTIAIAVTIICCETLAALLSLRSALLAYRLLLYTAAQVYLCSTMNRLEMIYRSAAAAAAARV